MAPGKSSMNWSKDGRLSHEYEVGVDKFIKYAFG